jgi:putative ABC transport system substrate-binding protein
VAEAQQPKKVPRIGYLGGASNPARIEAFRKGLRELGYVEGKNIAIEYRALAADLVRLKVDVIVTGGATSTRAAKEATPTIPLSWRRIPIPLETGSSPALRDQAGTLLDYQTLTGS